MLVWIWALWNIDILLNKFSKKAVCQAKTLTYKVCWVGSSEVLTFSIKQTRSRTNINTPPPQNRPQPIQSTLAPNKKHRKTWPSALRPYFFLRTARKSAQCCLRCLGFSGFSRQAASFEQVLKRSLLQLCQWHWNRLRYLFYFTFQKIIIIACFLGRDMFPINILLIFVVIMGPYCKSRSIGCLGIPVGYFTIPRTKG